MSVQHASEALTNGAFLDDRQLLVDEDSPSLSEEILSAPTLDGVPERPKSPEPTPRPLESLNYEVVENTVHAAELSRSDYRGIEIRRSFNRWTVCFLAGLGTAGVGFFIYCVLKEISERKFALLAGMFIKHANGYEQFITLFTWISINVAFVGVGACLCLFIAGPVAAGSGIPQIKCFLNGVKIPGVVSLPTLVAKAIGVLCSVAGGLVVGREGPMIHSGACVAATVSQGRTTGKYGVDCGIFEYYRSDREIRDFVSVGSAAGVAAAFGAPIGGVLFSLEEGASFWNQSLTWRMFFGAFTCAFFLTLFKAFYLQSGRQMSYAGIVDFGIFSNNKDAHSTGTEWALEELVLFVAFGVLGGLFGAAFNQLNLKLSIFRLKYMKSKWHKLAEALTVATVTACIGFVSITWLGNCEADSTIIPPINVTAAGGSQPRGGGEDFLIQTDCNEGYHRGMALLFLRTPEDATNALFHKPLGVFGPYTLSVFLAQMFVVACWTYGVSIASGLFIPCLLIGASWGRLICLGVDWLDITMLDPSKYAFAGAAAQLGGTVRMTVSLCVILMEATRDMTLALPLMIILIIAKWVGDYFNKGLYDIHIELAHVPLLHGEAPDGAGKIPAEKVMSRPVVVLDEVVNVRQLCAVLRDIPHHGFPVVDNIANTREDRFGRFKGIILRYQLFVLVHRKVFRATPDGPLLNDVKLKERHFRSEYRKADEAMVKSLDDLSDVELECWIDLRPFINKAAYCISENASLAKIFGLFRGLGLRHVVVVDDDHLVCGMVTRQDLVRFQTKEEEERREARSFSRAFSNVRSGTFIRGRGDGVVNT